MKRFCVFACLCLICVVLMADTALAGDVSSTAISLDLAAGSVEIYESEGITYCVQNEVTQATTGGVIVRQTDNATATANTITVSRGTCKVTISSLNIEAETRESPVNVKAGASLDLNLLGSSTVTGGFERAGIQVPAGATLTIGGSGSVTANGGGSYYGGAGIGGGRDGNGGSITINGGVVTAKGGGHGAGIGGGLYGAGGTVTINNGTVTAIGGSSGAGIGGGYYGAGGIVTINGGSITATGVSDGAGIGGGTHGDGGTITITGGTVTSTGGHEGSGIGSGNYGDGGTVTITGGTVIAIGSNYFGEKSADIGAGRYGTFDAVTISEKATVTNGEGDAPYIVETIFIDKQPLSSAAHLNNTPVSCVIAHNHSGLSYQWQISSDNENWTDLKGETASTTASFSMTEELVGSYLRCKLTNGWGNIEYTDSVQIYVLAFAQQPVSVEANLNTVVAFEATSTCSNVTYQWQRSYDDGATWSNVDGETYSTFIINATLSESTAKYRCIITATNGDQLASDEVCANVKVTDAYEYAVKTYLQDLETMEYVFHEQYTENGAVQIDGYEGFSENGARRVQEGVLENGTLVIHCYFDRNTYSITFDTNGGSALPALEALYGAAVEAPGDPTRYGHVFSGWYADEELTEEYLFDTMPLNGTTVYAKWAPVGADRGIEYKINNLAIRDSDTFELLDAIPKDNFLIEVSVTNLEATETDTILLVYYTDEGQMLGMNYMFANTPVGYTATFGASVDNNNGNIGIIRAFVLPSLGNPIPLANSAEIK